MSPPAAVLSRPRVLRRVVWALVVVVMLVFTGVAVALGRTSGGAQFRLADQLAMVGLGVLLSAAALTLTRARVIADLDGLRIRNVLSDRHLPWQVVREVRMDPGASWASLELHDDDTVALLGVQSNDGERSVEAVLGLRALLHASRGGPQQDGSA
ncbi:hypothetical protein BH24ACT10_BH24ACT10_11940 [soil metagenome]